MNRRRSLAMLTVGYVRAAFRKLGWPPPRRRRPRGGFTTTDLNAALKKHYGAYLEKIVNDDSPSPFLAIAHRWKAARG